MSVEVLIDTLSKGFITLETGGGKYSIKLEFNNSDDVWEAYEVLMKQLKYLQGNEEE